MGAAVSLARVNKNTMIVVSTVAVFTDDFTTTVDWGNFCLMRCNMLTPGSLVRDLGRRVNFYLDDNKLLSTFRQIQFISGSTTEGVDGATTVEPWRVGWVITFIAHTGAYPITTDNVARSAAPADQIRTFLETHKSRIYMDTGVGTKRRLIK